MTVPEPRAEAAEVVTGRRRLISYVLPVYDEYDNVNAFATALAEAVEARADDYDFEFVYVNDGSCDGSLGLLRALAARDRRVRVVDLSRNWGHQLAVTAGLGVARGDAVIVMDTDLQDPPAVSLELIAAWEQGWQVVYAQRRSRQDSLFKKVTASLFYRLLDGLAECHIPRDTGDFRLMDRRALDALDAMPEHSRFLRGMVAWVGYRQTAVEFDRDERHAGRTHYPLRKMVGLAVDGILGFSTAPLRWIGWLGGLVVTFSGFGVLYALFVRVFLPQHTVPGWAFTAIAIFFMGGVQVTMLSIIGAYVARIYKDVQGRPLYLVNSITPPPDD